jgi:hypothetical protein
MVICIVLGENERSLEFSIQTGNSKLQTKPSNSRQETGNLKLKINEATNRMRSKF